MAVRKKSDVIDTQNENEFIDVDLAPIKKQRFRFNGDNNKILELNISDAGMLSRLEEAYPKLDELTSKVQELEEEVKDVDEDNVDDLKMSTLAQQIDTLDKGMREIVDNIFNAPVSQVLCGDDFTMFDPINGKFMYEHIIDLLSSKYEENIHKESQMMKDRLRKHTGKYNK